MFPIPETHEAIGQLTAGGPITSFQQPTRRPGPEQVLVRVQWVAGTSVTVWIVDFGLINPEYPFVIGENIVGEVLAVGDGVTEVNPGDRISSFSFPEESYGKASQEYVLLSRWSISKLPANITSQEAATMPDNLVTAYFSLFDQLRLPTPRDFPASDVPQDASTPILVWGAGGSVGQYAVQLLRLAGYKKILAVASARHHEYIRSLGATDTFDYNDGDVVKQISATTGGSVNVVLDAISDEENSLEPISRLVGEGSRVAYLLPIRVGHPGSVQGVKRTTDLSFPENVELIAVGARYYHKNEDFKRRLQPEIIPDLIARGLIKPNRYKEIQGATLLEKVTASVDLLRRGAVSGERLVFQVAKE